MDALVPVYATLGALVVPVLCVVIGARHLPLTRRLAEPARTRIARLVRILGGFVLLVCLAAAVGATVLAMTQKRVGEGDETHTVRFGRHAPR